MNLIGSKTIETDRLILKSSSMEEQKRLWEILMNPEVNKFYLTSAKNKANDKEYWTWQVQEKFYKSKVNKANNPDTFVWSIFLKPEYTNNGYEEAIGQISAQESGIPVEAGAGHSADGGHVDVEHHVLDEVGVVKVLMLEALRGQLGIGLPAVGVGFGHPAVADVGVDDDLVFPVHRDHAGELAHGPVAHAAVMHGKILGLPGDLQDAVLAVQVGEVLKPLRILLEFRQLGVISHRFSHVFSS